MDLLLHSLICARWSAGHLICASLLLLVHHLAGEECVMLGSDYVDSHLGQQEDAHLLRLPHQSALINQ